MTPSDSIAAIAGHHYRYPFETEESVRFVAPGVIYHSATDGPKTLAAWKENHERLLQAFRVTASNIVHQVTEGDLVITHWRGEAVQIGPFQGAAPTGATVTMRGFGIDRVEGGLVVEHWGLQDALGLLRQLGFRIEPPTDA